MHFDGKDPWGFSGTRRRTQRSLRVHRSSNSRQAPGTAERRHLALTSQLTRGMKHLGRLLGCFSRRIPIPWAPRPSVRRDTCVYSKERGELFEVRNRTTISDASSGGIYSQRTGRPLVPQLITGLSTIYLPDRKSPAGLLKLAAEFKSIQERRRVLTKKNKSRQTPVTTAAYGRAKCCWRCKQRGHTRF